ncbi:SDR family oxidoreductase [Mycobacterium sp. CVI_P3]|uniref:SDR family oxidoreductase n=1 Tax=Mycobacterium pinniadriaticum TaxID=2994102 RepID=A0ABT3SL88_9MYCO|nr:NAD(P)-binding oxidoreductase [Mycobacterium pinniadriaticum]MCX2933715.1 SDR family oxidoreductase [Mycobacterium pinniadriaticum]MCX2940137.1 SDR family oxidoreductase [Mycobacterium pinniadriaticum]
MRVTVFGASGKIGSLVVDDLLADGHYVTAYLRDPGKLKISHPNLTTIEGELSDPDRIRQTVRGADAVITVFKPGVWGPVPS